MAKSILPFVLFWLAAAPVFAQKQPPPLLNVFLDFYNSPAEPGFLKSEIAFVNYVRDPALCDVQVQQTTELAGNDARREVLFFFGRGRFEGQNDTASFVVQPAENQGIVRERLLRAFKKGLLKYLLQTEWAASIDYALSGADNAPVRDGWNLWTYNLNLNGRFFGNAFHDDNGFFGKYSRASRETDLQGAFNVWRTGQLWRFDAGVRYVGSFGRDEYVNYPAFPAALDTVFHTTSERLLLDAELVRTLGQHFSVGAWGAFNRNYTANQYNSSQLQHQLSVAAGVEYSFLPYRDWFRRQFVVGYYLSYFDNDTGLYIGGPTISPLVHHLYTDFARVSKWGYFALGLDCDYQPSPDYWDSFATSARAQLGLNLRQNLFLTLGGNFSLNNRQSQSIGTSPPTVFSRNARSTSYFSEIGIAYYFGSGFQNIINPRLWRTNAAL